MKTDAGGQDQFLRYEKYLDEQSSLADVADFMEKRRMKAFTDKIKQVNRQRVASANAAHAEQIRPNTDGTAGKPVPPRQLALKL